MICFNCQARERPADRHQHCPGGTWCDCAHQAGSSLPPGETRVPNASSRTPSTLEDAAGVDAFRAQRRVRLVQEAP